MCYLHFWQFNNLYSFASQYKTVVLLRCSFQWPKVRSDGLLKFRALLRKRRRVFSSKIFHNKIVLYFAVNGKFLLIALPIAIFVALTMLGCCCYCCCCKGSACGECLLDICCCCCYCCRCIGSGCGECLREICSCCCNCCRCIGSGCGECLREICSCCCNCCRCIRSGCGQCLRLLRHICCCCCCDKNRSSFSGTVTYLIPSCKSLTKPKIQV